MSDQTPRVPALRAVIDDEVMSAAHGALEKYGAKPTRLIGPWMLDIINNWVGDISDPFIGPEEARKEAVKRFQGVPATFQPHDPLPERWELVYRYDCLMHDLPEVFSRFKSPGARAVEVRKVLVEILGALWKTCPLPGAATPSELARSCLRATEERIRRARRYVYAEMAWREEAAADYWHSRGEHEYAERRANLARSFRRRDRPGRRRRPVASRPQ